MFEVGAVIASDRMRHKGLLPLRIITCCFLALLAPGVEGRPRAILFVGNSFTFGYGSPVRGFRPDLVTDLNGEGIGGVPALFRTFVDESGQAWRVSLETSPGKPLAWHLANRRAIVARRWDVVVLQGHSLLDEHAPGDPATHIAAARALAAVARRTNEAARVDLVSTWSRPDQTYPASGHWHGWPIERMAQDLQRANEQALAGSPDLHDVIPVGDAFNRAIHEGVADPDPYDGIAFGQVDLWTFDHYHASTAGYYLEALVIFAHVTGVDPRRLGPGERAADALELDPALAQALQRVASEELAPDQAGSASPGADPTPGPTR